jgi:biotin carboxylase
VEDAAALEREFPLVKREAELAFGDGGVYLEAYLPERGILRYRFLRTGMGRAASRHA